jgi:hypothetical protein
MVIRILFILILVIGISAAAEEKGVQAKGIGVASMIQMGLRLLPQSDARDTALDYLDIIQPKYYMDETQIGSANYGIIFTLKDRFDHDLKFQQQAIHLYQEVATYMNQRLRGPSENPADRTCKDDGQGAGPYLINYICEKHAPRILLSERAGEGRNQAFEPGWLWKLALKNADGNGNDALELIALCGHDNRFQGAKEVTTKDGTADLNCPVGASAFFVPGALGDGIDISPELRKKIESIQNPSGEFKIPAKYYHIMAESFIACRLFQKNHSESSIAKISDLAGLLYRGITVCNQVKAGVREYWPVEEEMHRERFFGAVEDFVETKIDEYHKDFDHFYKYHPKVFADTIRYMSSNFSRAVETDSGWQQMELHGLDRKNVIRRILTQHDAAYLYQKWFKGGESLLFGLTSFPCTTTQFSGPRDLLNPSSSFKPERWSEIRYRLASRKVATYLMDFEWSRAEHLVGTKFAAHVCHP